MILDLNSSQILKLSDLCMDLAKGLYLASFLAPSLNSMISLFNVMRSLIAGVILTYISLKLLTIKEETL